MTTAQDIREKTFTKQLNGYAMSQVDDFLDQLAADITALAKENASLKSKMRVLVEKVEEYRSTEDSMRSALLSAQKTGAQIESDAQARADAIVAEARDAADRISRRSAEGIANEEAKLAEAKKATDRFFDHMRLVCQKQIEFYEKLSRMRLVGEDTELSEEEPAEAEEPEEAAPEAEETPRETEMEQTVRSIESSVAEAALTEPEEPISVDTDIPEEEEEPTRRFGDPAPSRKKRSFDDFRFDDDI